MRLNLGTGGFQTEISILDLHNTKPGQGVACSIAAASGTWRSASRYTCVCANMAAEFGVPLRKQAFTFGFIALTPRPRPRPRPVPRQVHWQLVGSERVLTAVPAAPSEPAINN
jgi:hypothetical protein